MQFLKEKEKSESPQKPLTSIQFKMLKSVRQTIKTIATKSSGLSEICDNHHFNGTFKQLSDKNLLQEILFPGTSKHILENLPKDLKEILEWEELELDIRKIAISASEVLENIKIRGMQQGDVMDEMTETVLLPQIGQEALAKGIVESVRKLSRKVSKINAKISTKFASPQSEKANYDQIETSEIMELNGAKKIGIQEEYMGEEWKKLILDDIKRYIKYEKMATMNKLGAVIVNSEEKIKNKDSEEGAHMCWIEPEESLKEMYPALAELVDQLHALPYEINGKWAETSKMKLLEPSKGCTMLLRYPVGTTQNQRLDSKDDGSDLDSGIRVVCSYHLCPEDETVEKQTSEDTSSSSFSNFNFYSENGEKLILSVPIKDDLMVLHSASSVRNERTKALKEYYAVVFFIQGKEI